MTRALRATALLLACILALTVLFGVASLLTVLVVALIAGVF